MKAITLTALFFSLFLMPANVAKAANLISNGDFSVGDSSVGGYGYVSSIPDWTTVSVGYSNGINGPDTTAVEDFAPANETSDNKGNAVADFAFLQVNGETTNADISQTFSVVAGDTYTLTLDVGSREYTPGGVAYVSFGDSAGDAATPFEANTNDSDIYGAQFQFETLSFVATANSTGKVELENLAASDGSNFGTIDYTNVDVTGPAPVGVPEPSTWALAALGIGSLGFFLRRRNGKA